MKKRRRERRGLSLLAGIYLQRAAERSEAARGGRAALPADGARELAENFQQEARLDRPTCSRPAGQSVISQHDISSRYLPRSDIMVSPDVSFLCCQALPLQPLEISHNSQKPPGPV
ncbi:UNVERIFIED_CONTAM: hypothetical protein K2H54_055758 [Gekko kuhli]